MITLFIIIGLVGLGGGLATIVDGLPYLVLERGFTQVLGGVTAATGGLIILALAWVLIEIRRMRSALPSAPAQPAQPPQPVIQTEAPVSAAPLVGMGQASSYATPLNTSAPVLGAIAVGAAAATAGAVMAGPLETRPVDEEEAAEPPHEENVTSSDAEATSEAPEPEPASGPEFDRSDLPADGWAPASWPEAASPARASDPFAEAIAAAMQPHQYEAPQAADDSDDRDADPADKAPDVASVEGIDLLRENLLGPAPSASALDTAPEPEPEAADAWMLSVRREDSWMTSLPSAREEAAPPPADLPVDEAEDEPAPDAPELEAAAPAEPELEVAEPEPAPEAEPTEPSPPASSEEGIIGAYQVGDAHFTIYADGSIKARTPDGDYDFDSMEELKAYLASEKSRLGL